MQCNSWGTCTNYLPMWAKREFFFLRSSQDLALLHLTPIMRLGTVVQAKVEIAPIHFAATFVTSHINCTMAFVLIALNSQCGICLQVYHTCFWWRWFHASYYEDCSQSNPCWLNFSICGTVVCDLQSSIGIKKASFTSIKYWVRHS